MSELAILLAAKLLLAPLLIAAITMAGDRFGPRVAGGLIGLPVVAGPIALFIALEQGTRFAAHAAVATLAGEVSLAAFCLAYGLACVRTGWPLSLAAGWGAFGLATLAFERFDPTLPQALAMVLLAPLVVSALAPRPALPDRVAGSSGWEIGVRMAAGAALLIGLTGMARALGPRLSGLLTVFPIAGTVLTVFSHRRQGGAFAARLLRGFAVGLYSLTAFFATVAIGLERLGIAIGFAVAAAAAIAAAIVIQAIGRRVEGVAPGPPVRVSDSE